MFPHIFNPHCRCSHSSSSTTTGVHIHFQPSPRVLRLLDSKCKCERSWIWVRMAQGSMFPDVKDFHPCLCACEHFFKVENKYFVVCVICGTLSWSCQKSYVVCSCCVYTCVSVLKDSNKNCWKLDVIHHGVQGEIGLQRFSRLKRWIKFHGLYCSQQILLRLCKKLLLGLKDEGLLMVHCFFFFFSLKIQRALKTGSYLIYCAICKDELCLPAVSREVCEHV